METLICVETLGEKYKKNGFNAGSAFPSCSLSYNGIKLLKCERKLAFCKPSPKMYSLETAQTHFEIKDAKWGMLTLF